MRYFKKPMSVLLLKNVCDGNPIFLHLPIYQFKLCHLYSGHDRSRSKHMHFKIIRPNGTDLYWKTCQGIDKCSSILIRLTWGPTYEVIRQKTLEGFSIFALEGCPKLFLSLE